MWIAVSLVGPEAAPSQAERARIATRAADTHAAIGRWDDELAVCIGATGEGDDSDATCTHEAWNELVLQVEVAMYYLLNDLRAMPRGACHDALAAQNDLLRAFWHGAAPLNQAWLDEQQRPPSLFDLRAAVDLVRPVPGKDSGCRHHGCARDPLTPCPTRRLGTLGSMPEVDGKPLDERLQEIGAQLAWVRDYL